jgi:hypothetical protein
MTDESDPSNFYKRLGYFDPQVTLLQSLHNKERYKVVCEISHMAQL